MRAALPNRQTGVATHVFSRSEELQEAQTPPESTRGSTSPLELGQDLVKVSVSPFEPATFALATREDGVHESRPTLPESASFDFIRVFRRRPRVGFHDSSRGFFSFMCPACATPPVGESPGVARRNPGCRVARLSNPLHETKSMLDRRRGDRRRVIASAPPPSPTADPTAIPAGAERRRSSVAIEWLGVDQAARYLGLPSRKALYQAVRRGQVPVHRLGTRRMRFRRAELDQVLERGRQRSVLHSS